MKNFLGIVNFFKFKRNVEDSDQNHVKENLLLKQALVALGPLLLTVASGMISGYSAVLLPQLQSENNTFKTDPEQASWIASMAALPMPFGSIIGGFLIEHIGRRNCHLISTIPIFLGWILIYFSNSINMILAGRFLTGICVGILGAATGVYIGETSEPKYRGFFLGAISFAISLGLLLSHFIGSYINWKTTALICSTIPIICLFIIPFTPESPSYYAKKGNAEEARKSFKWCRGSSVDAIKELDVIIKRNSENVTIKEKKFLEKVIVPEFIKPLIILTVFIVSNQWAGINAVTFYTVSIMKETIGDGVNEYLAMIIIDVIRLLFSIIACILMRKMKRRTLAIISGVGTFSSLFILSGFTYLAKYYPSLGSYSIIPTLLFVSYISFISIGFVPLPWAMIGEVFPLISRNIGSGITTFLAFSAFFSVVKLSPSMFSTLGPEGAFLVFGIVAFIGTLFIFIFLPETKGKPLHEIEDYFKRKFVIKSSDSDNNNVNNVS